MQTIIKYLFFQKTQVTFFWLPYLWFAFFFLLVKYIFWVCIFLNPQIVFLKEKGGRYLGPRKNYIEPSLRSKSMFSK